MRCRMIQSESNVQIKELIKLQKNARERKKKKLFVAEGMKLTKEAAFHGKLKKIYIAQDVYEHRERELDDFLAKQDYEVVDTKIFRQAAFFPCVTALRCICESTAVCAS